DRLPKQVMDRLVSGLSSGERRQVYQKVRVSLVKVRQPARGGVVIETIEQGQRLFVRREGGGRSTVGENARAQAVRVRMFDPEGRRRAQQVVELGERILIETGGARVVAGVARAIGRVVEKLR